MTLTAASTSRSGGVSGTELESLLLHVDEHLFTPKGWFLLDEDNVRLRPVASLRAGLRAIATGEAATVAGTLRREALVVDVDIDDEVRGLAVVEQLAGWATERDVWHIVRPSGGAPGRHHVFLIPADHADDFAHLVPQLRRRHKVSSVAVDVRRGRSAVRPLSAPHRRGGCPRPMGLARLRQRVIELHQLLPTAPVPLRGARLSPAEAVAVATTSAEASRRRARRPLDPAWERYLEHGEIPDVDVDVEKRSTVELMATTAMVRAGMDVYDAWQVVLGAHVAAMRKARERGQAWWMRYVWNQAVRTDNAWLATHAPARPSPARQVDEGAWRARVAAQAARDALTVLQWSVPERQRPTWLMIAHAQLDRLAAAGELVAPCPERDLQVDTGVDRKVVRAHLKTAAALGLWELVDAFDPRQRATSSQMTRLDSRFDPERALTQSPPPVVHTPNVPTAPPAHLLRLLPTLPAGAHALWRTLPPEDEAVSLPGAGRAAGLTSGPFAEPSDRQRVTIAAHLHTLAAAGLADQDAAGRWYRRDEPTEGVRAAAAAARSHLINRVTQERLRYRNSGGHAQWAAQRDAALAADVARGQAHWRALTHQEQVARRAAARAAFFALSPVEQERQKTRFVERRARISGHQQPESAFHDEWRNRIEHLEFERRSVAGQIWFATLDKPTQRAFVTSWASHRARHGIRRSRTDPDLSRRPARIPART